MQRSARGRRGLIGFMVFGCLVSPLALAQEKPLPISSPAGSGPPQTDTEADASGDIVVTARFRSERLQDTPLSISAFNAASIENTVVTDVASIQKLLPNVQLARVTYAGNSLAASIRGISFADLEKTFDPAIGVAIDGVFLGTATGGNVDFNDVESIEVLRGPQGTLYGRNTVGGTISIRRTRPTGEFGASLHARYSTYNNLDLDAVVNLPSIGDALSLKLFGQRRTGDSFTRNRNTGKREPGRDYYSVGASALLEAGPETTILATVEYMKDRSFYPSVVNMTSATGLPFGAGGNLCDFTLAIGLGDLACGSQGYLRQRGEKYKIANTSQPFQSYMDGWAASLEINSKIGQLDLSAITGFRSSRDSLLEENSGTGLVPVAPGVSIPLFVASRDQRYKQFSQEIRVQGDVTDWMDIVGGVYYLHTDYGIKPYSYNGDTRATAYLLGGPIQSFTAEQKLDSYAVFAESIFKLGNQVRLTVGGRYTTETKKFGLTQTIPVFFTASGKKTWSEPTGRIILDWKPNDDAMLYASWSRGTRSGGFNGRATTTSAIGPYEPEKVDSYEVGLKLDLLDGLIRFNPAVFLANYNNKQEEILRNAPPPNVGTETVIQNASTAQIKGIEFDLQIRPSSDLTLRASGGHIDGKYKSFLIENIAVPGTFIDVAKQRNFRRAPKYTLNAGADYNRDIGNGNSIAISLNYSYIDHYSTSPMPDATGAKRDILPARGSVDASLAFIRETDTLRQLRIAIFGNDLFHSGGRIATTLDAGVFYFANLVPNRTYGIEASVKF